MSTFTGDHDEPGKNKQPDENVQFENCMLYVKRVWPDDDYNTQFARAEAVFAISKVFFTEIIPGVVQKNMAFSEN